MTTLAHYVLMALDRIVASVLLFGALLLLFGCANNPALDNRVVCTLDKSEMHVISKWWVFSIGSQVAADDAVFCTLAP